jgi:hypothetical protein
MPAFIDLTGQKFGRLTVIEHVKFIDGKRFSGWLCKCDCGNTTYQKSFQLRNNLVKSCGCYAKERTHNVHIAETHGDSKSRLYITWRNMRVRCFYPKDKRYSEYGGRGITVCDEWKNSFEAFRDWAIANGYSDDLTIDRINVNGNYCPENCRFITRAENNKNRRCIKRGKNNER